MQVIDRLECCDVDERRPSSAPHQQQQQQQQQQPDRRFEAGDCRQQTAGPMSTLLPGYMTDPRSIYKARLCSI